MNSLNIKKNIFFLSLLSIFIVYNSFISCNTSILAYELITKPEKTYGDGLGYGTKFNYSLDSSKIAVTSLGVVYVYDTEAWDLVGSVKTNTGAIYTSCPSNDGKLLMTGGLSDETTAEAILWDLSTGQKIKSFQKENESQITNIFLLPNEKQFISSTYTYEFPDYFGKTYLWDIETGEIVKQYDVAANSLSPDGLTFINISFVNNPTSSIWNIETSQKIIDLSSRTGTGTNSTLFSPDGEKIFTRWNGSVKIFDAIDGSLVFELAPEEIKAFGVNWANNTVTLIDSFYTFHTYDIDTGNKLKTGSVENTYSSFPTNIAFSKTGEEYIYLNNRGVSVYDNNTDKEIKSLTASFAASKIIHGRIISYSNSAMKISPDNQKMLLRAIGKDQIIDTQTGKQLYYLDQWQLSVDGILPEIRYLPNLDLFFTYFKENDLLRFTNKEKVKDVKVYLTAEPPVLVKTFTTGHIYEARFIPAQEQMMITSFQDNLIDLLDVKTGDIITSYIPDSMPDLSDLVSHNGDWFCVSRTNNYICNINTGEILNSYSPYIIGEWLNSIQAISYDDKYLLSNFGLIWDVDSGEIIHDLNLPQNHFSIVNDAVDFSPDGNLLAIKYLYSGNVHIYSTQNWEELYQLEGLYTYSSIIKFTEDSKHLYTCAQDDGYVKYWSIPDQQPSVSNWQIF